MNSNGKLFFSYNTRTIGTVHLRFHSSERILNKGKYHSTSDLLLDWVGFNRKVNLLEVYHLHCSLSLTCKTIGQLYINSCPYKISKYYLATVLQFLWFTNPKL